MATSIRLNADIEQRLNQLAARTGRSKAYYLRLFITDGLVAMEDYYRAEATMTRVMAGKEKVFSAAQVRAELGFDSQKKR